MVPKGEKIGRRMDGVLPYSAVQSQYPILAQNK